jgi:N-dimethylarginine dimethylaminohydrolase
MPPNCAFEGEGDAFLIDDVIVAGYLKRTDICAHRYLSQLTGKQVLSLELVDDRWYHSGHLLFAAGRAAGRLLPRSVRLVRAARD